MLDVFESVLRRLDKQGRDEHGDAWMGLVKDRFGMLEESYKVLNQQGRLPINYAELPTQASYIFAYAMSRAYFSDEFLRRHRAAVGKALFNEEEITVVSFGGGPGSELVGLLNYLDDDNMGENVTSISYRVYDKDVDWKPVARKVVRYKNSDIDVNLSYHKLDLADENTTALIDVGDANLIVFSYIMSELCALDAKDIISTNVNRILSTMSSGTAMMFVESKQPEFINFFKACKGYHGKRKNDDDNGIDIDLPQFGAKFQKYVDELERTPRMSSGSILSQWYVKS
jgi:hypothetical protein